MGPSSQGKQVTCGWASCRFWEAKHDRITASRRGGEERTSDWGCGARRRGESGGPDAVVQLGRLV